MEISTNPEKLRMKRILIRAGKDPFSSVSPQRIFQKNVVGNNSGNMIFSNAAWKTLHMPGSQIARCKMTMTPDDAANINASQDMLVLPFANAFRHSFKDALVSWTATIRQLRIPVVVLGIGAQGLVDGDMKSLSSIDEEVTDFVSAVLDRSASIGVRGEFTAEYLSKLGFRDVEIIGCPSMFYHGANLKQINVGKLRADSKIAVNVSPYLPEMIRISDSTLARYRQSIYVAQDVDTLGLMLDAPKKPNFRANNRIVNENYSALRNGRAYFFYDPSRWFEFLSECSFSFGSRIHGNIAALIAGTPAFVLAHDSRTLELCRYFEIPHSKLKDTPDNVDPARLLESADYGPMQRNHLTRYRAYTGFLARNGVPFGCDDQVNLDSFDAAIAAAQLPPGVRSQRTPLWKKNPVSDWLRSTFGAKQ